MKVEIIDTEIMDHKCGPDEDDNYCVSGVSVYVKFKIDDQEYGLDYQTSTTFDYGAISSSIRAYDGTDDYDQLREKFDDDQDDDFFSLLDEIKTKSNAQKVWNEYIGENYIRNVEHYGGVDADSEIDRMSKKGG